MARINKDFYEIQSLQWKKSLFVFTALIFFYFVAVGLVSLAVVLSLGFFGAGQGFWTGLFIYKLLGFDLLASVLIAWFHFQDARRFGAGYILKRLEARSPDPADRIHKQFLNTLDEVRIAAGVPKVNAYVIPAFAVNSMALVEADKTPAVAITEGLLAECTRDELQAVAAHELAHIARGDAFYVTLVCSLANSFEKLKEALEPEHPEPQPGLLGRRTRGWGGSPALIYVAAAISSFVMRLLSMLISRERELLADAAAVEFGRDPSSLARAIYKAHIQNSFVGDFSASYGPLFIVAPESPNIQDNFFGRLFNSHPPIMKRIEALAAMADKKPDRIIREIWESRESREKAREVLLSFEEMKVKAGPTTSGAEERPEASAAAPRGTETVDAKTWSVRSAGGGWEEPMTIGELVSRPAFSNMAVVKNFQEGVEAKAREFPQVRLALRDAGRKRPVDPGHENKCPRCRVPLAETFYEGVAIKLCPRCQGKLVDEGMMDRVIARKEVTFSKGLVRKAMDFKERFLSQPIKTRKISETQPPDPLTCPDCGATMKARPYSYSYFIPVDKCLSCHKIWFDADELEILQVLIENR
jgi:Zn-dependent protease with chaperone function/Zn-finger nucleic acid-binding protein